MKKSRYLAIVVSVLLSQNSCALWQQLTMDIDCPTGYHPAWGRREGAPEQKAELFCLGNDYSLAADLQEDCRERNGTFLAFRDPRDGVGYWVCGVGPFHAATESIIK